MNDRSFFIDSRGVATGPVATPEPALGFTSIKCTRCSLDWDLAAGSCKCGSSEFVEEFHAPVPFTRGPFGKLVAAILPDKPAAPRATAEQVTAIRNFQATLERVGAELAELDELIRVAVRGGIEELEPSHNVLHLASSTTGDTSLTNVRDFSLGLRSFVAGLSIAVANLEDPK